MIIFLFAIAVVLFWFAYDHHRHSNFPPGPTRLPILGNLLQIAWQGASPPVALKKLSKIHGDIMFIRIGFTNAITFNSYESIRDILSHELATERNQDMVPVMWERMSRKNLGLLIVNGKAWKTLRRFTIRTLRDFGFGKASSMDVVINEELENFVQHVRTLNAQNPTGIANAETLFHLTVTNVLWRLVTGKQYELDDPNMHRLLKMSNEVVQSSNFAFDITVAYPQLYHLFPTWSGKTDQMHNMKQLCEFVQETIDHQRMLGEYKISSNSYLDEFLVKIDENKGDSESEFTDEQLVLCLLDLFQAGSDATSNTMAFCMLYMLVNEEVQGKVQAEIDANVPDNENIMLSMRKKLPYTCATLSECLRHSAVVPTPAARQASADFNFRGYSIKKGMALLPNVYAVHLSEQLWGDPLNFRPARFLNQDGKLDRIMTSYLLQFGYGSRRCLAATQGEDTIFLYFATMLRNFKIVKAAGVQEYSTVPKPGMIESPKPYKARFVPRR